MKHQTIPQPPAKRTAPTPATPASIRQATVAGTLPVWLRRAW